MALIGIDLGTTNSLIAVFGEAGPTLIPNALGDVLTPSVVGVDDANEIMVGRAARERLLTHPDKTVASFKRFMGSTRETILGRHRFRPEELSALVLRALKADAEAQISAAVTEAVISVPAYFNDLQRKATLDAGRLAGLKVERLVNEPTAAALAYGLYEVKEGKFLVFDLGGGTFDVSILDKYEGVMEVRATAGDVQLGGDDFTNVIEQMLADNHEFHLPALTPTAAARLRRTAEALKLTLTSAESAPYELALDDATLSGTLNRQSFEEASAALLRRLRAPVERAIADALLKPEELDNVVLVGGATRMPMVRSLAARLFGRLPLVHIDPDRTVALGAAVQAGLKARAAALEDVVMTDVCPYTLGVAAVDGVDTIDRKHVAPIIERNAVVPISRTKVFRTIQNRQRRIEFEVYQGENLRPEHNILLGSLMLHVPSNQAGAEAAEVRFTYDINGSLEVEATALSTGAKETQIFRKAAGLTEAELEQRFAALAHIKMHPREQAENKLLIARAERLYEEHRGDARELLRQVLMEFEEAIAEQQIRDLSAVRASFSALLDGFER
jgi:molecular chaperone HscC